MKVVGCLGQAGRQRQAATPHPELFAALQMVTAECEALRLASQARPRPAAPSRCAPVLVQSLLLHAVAPARSGTEDVPVPRSTTQTLALGPCPIGFHRQRTRGMRSTISGTSLWTALLLPKPSASWTGD